MLTPTVLKVAVVAAPLLLSGFTPPAVRPEATSAHPSRFESLASKSGISADQIAEWRRILNRTARISKRKEKAVEMRRLILAGLEAKSQADYNAITQQLQAKLAGHIRTRHYRDLTGAAPAEQKGDRSRRASGPTSREQCTTEEGGVWYTDECQTDEEIADNIVWATALYAETVADYDEGYDDCYATSANPGVECEWDTSPSPAPAVEMSLGVERLPRLAEGDDTAPCQIFDASADGAGLPHRLDCIQQGLDASVSFSLFGAGTAVFFSKYGSAIRAAGTAARAARVTLLVTAFNFGYKIGTFINCIAALSPLDSAVPADAGPRYSFIL